MATAGTKRNMVPAEFEYGKIRLVGQFAKRTSDSREAIVRAASSGCVRCPRQALHRTGHPMFPVQSVENRGHGGGYQSSTGSRLNAPFVSFPSLL